MQHTETVVVVAAGSGPAHLRERPDGAHVIAADGGVDTALALGLTVDEAIGDFDSVTDAGLAAAVQAGARIERHPQAKDATDLELALDLAVRREPGRVLVVGSASGRLDHLAASLLLLASPAYEAVEVDAQLGDALVHVIRHRRVLSGEKGALLTLLPVHGAADGVSTEGLLYPLDGETLHAGTSRGVSNVFEDTTAVVTVERGVVLAIRPGDAT